jgi:hypothetical protein
MVSNLLFAFVLAMGTQGFEPNLTDQACGITDVRLAPAPGAEISGHCDDVDSARMLQVSLTTEDPRFRGAVKQMSLGFCGESSAQGLQLAGRQRCVEAVLPSAGQRKSHGTLLLVRWSPMKRY